MSTDETPHLLAAQQSRKMEQLALAINIALKILSARALTVLALLLEAGLFGWAMAQGGWDRLAIAAVFTVGAWATVNLRPRKDE